MTLFVPTSYPGDPCLAFWWDRLHHALVNATDETIAAGSAVETVGGGVMIGTAESRDRAYKSVRSHVKSLPHEEAMAHIQSICDRLQAPPPVNRVLDWAELHRLAREGVTMAPHTRTHPIIDRISRDAAREEIVGSYNDLRERIGPVAKVFAYPSGKYSESVVQLLAEEGFQAGFTTRRGINDLRQCQRFLLSRNNVGHRATVPMMRTQLLPQMRWFNAI